MHAPRLTAVRPAAGVRLLPGVLLVLVIAGFAAARAADVGGFALFDYLKGLNSLSTQFTQTVTDAHGLQAEAGRGTLQVQRPNHFRWDYRPSPAAGDASTNGGATGTAPSPDAGNADDSGQLMVADGKNLWFYDRELAQVTVKPITAALSSTPIMLLSGPPEQLRETFDMTPGGTHDGLLWVQVKPHSATADFSSAELGFKGQQLTRMVVHDNLGQTVRLDFQHAERNGSLPPSLFEFKSPAGVDVIGSPH
jgi:outer membrane lipoprotein carrier protein